MPCPLRPGMGTPHRLATDPLRGSQPRQGMGATKRIGRIRNPSSRSGQRLYIHCVTINTPLSHREPSPAAAKRPRETASKLGAHGAPFFFEKMFSISPGGVWGLSRCLGGAVWLGNAHRWSSWAYFPTPVFVLAPISASFGLNLPSFGGLRLSKSGSDLDLGRRGGR